MRYTALMVDMVKSKKFSKVNREAVQLFIKQTLDVLNKVFRPSLAFDVIFSSGDEFQGLFRDPASAVMYFRLLKMILFPLQIRCGMGVGEWDVKIMDGTSSEQDGSAYHHAREAILKAHHMAEWSVLFNSINDHDFYINTLLNASFLLSYKQSIYQNTIALLVELSVPFFDAQAMELSSVQEIIDLLQKKESVSFYSSARGKNNNHDIFKNIDAASFENEPIEILSENMYDEKMVFKSTLRKGISTKISTITQTTRQNIDNIIKSADIPYIRQIDLTTIHYIYKYFQR